MFYLLMAVLASAFVSICMRFSDRHAHNHLTMLGVNYIVCLALSVANTGFEKLSLHGNGLGIALSFGLLNGFFYLSSFLLLQINLKRNGIVLSGTFMKLGVLVPTTISILFFHETPTLMQIAGFLVSLAAILLIHFEKGHETAPFKIGLLLLLLGGGSGDAMAKLYQELGNPQFESLFLCFTFLCAFLICLFLCIYKHQSITKEDLLFGLFIGIPNYFSVRFILQSLYRLPAIIVYPTYSVATIVVLSITGMLFFKETITKQQKIAIGLILVALIFLNV